MSFSVYVDSDKYWFISKRRQHSHVHTLVNFFPYKLKYPVSFYIMVALITIYTQYNLIILVLLSLSFHLHQISYRIAMIGRECKWNVNRVWIEACFDEIFTFEIGVWCILVNSKFYMFGLILWSYRYVFMNVIVSSLQKEKSIVRASPHLCLVAKMLEWFSLNWKL